MAETAMKLHNKVQGYPYAVKMTAVVLSPFAPCFPKTQQAVYEVLAMGPKEDAYKITVWNALDVRGLFTVMAAYGTGIGLQSMGVTDYMPPGFVQFAKDNATILVYATLAEAVIMPAIGYAIKKPMPRPLGLITGINPILWLDTIRVTKNSIKAGSKMFSESYAAFRKQVEYIFPDM